MTWNKVPFHLMRFKSNIWKVNKFFWHLLPLTALYGVTVTSEPSLGDQLDNVEPRTLASCVWPLYTLSSGLNHLITKLRFNSDKGRFLVDFLQRISLNIRTWRQIKSNDIGHGKMIIQSLRRAAGLDIATKITTPHPAWIKCDILSIKKRLRQDRINI